MACTLVSAATPVCLQFVEGLLPGTALGTLTTDTTSRLSSHCFVERWGIDLAFSLSHGCILIHPHLLPLCNLPLQLFPAARPQQHQLMVPVQNKHFAENSTNVSPFVVGKNTYQYWRI